VLGVHGGRHSLALDAAAQLGNTDVIRRTLVTVGAGILCYLLGEWLAASCAAEIARSAVEETQRSDESEGWAAEALEAYDEETKGEWAEACRE
jgi:hypothetical protein